MVSRIKLRTLRRQRGLTQVALADAMGVGEWTVQAWERGKHRPRPENATVLCHVLECDLEELLEQPSASPKETDSREVVAKASGGNSDA